MSQLDGKRKQHLNGEKAWLKASVNSFWGTIASNDHIVQVYEEDDIMITSMAQFIQGGIAAGECSVLFLTRPHLSALDKKLNELGIDPEALKKDQLYFPFNADEILDKFIIDNWPDTPLLYLTISETLSAPTATGRKVRGGGEMVAILREREQIEATIQLEKLWREIYEKDPFCIFCVYPRRVFEGDIYHSLSNICCQHTMMVAGDSIQLNEVCYRELEPDHHQSHEILRSS